MLTGLRICFVWLFIFTILLGDIYPAVVTGVAQLAFHNKANGSVIERDGQAVGSALIGQGFTQPRYFWGRPSSASYNPASSSGSNFGPMHPDLRTQVEARAHALRAADPKLKDLLPADLVMSSASGLDPHISLAAAEVQIARVARARRMKEEELRALVESARRGRMFGMFGEPNVNVLELNLALDQRAVDGR